MTLEDLVPPLEMCRPIAHLFPDSIFSWHKRCDLGCENWFIHRSDCVLWFCREIIPAPTISEMLQVCLPQTYHITWCNTHGKWEAHYWAEEKKTVEGTEFDRIEDTTAALIAWQIEQGLPPKAGEK